MNDTCVNLCIYVTPEASVDKNRITEDVRRASTVWNQCQIEFRVIKLTTYNNDLELARLSFRDKELTYRGDLNIAPQTDDVKKLTKLLSIRTGCEGTESIHVAVYYIGGDSYSDGTTSCFYFQKKGSNRLFSIILTNGAKSDNFAHELGHALFVRPDSNGNFDDPDVNADPNDKIHNTHQCNLMHISVTGITITQDQCNQANKSELIRKCSIPPEMFREISISGTMHIRDDDDPWEPDVCDFKLRPKKVLKLSPIKTGIGFLHLWEETCDEIKILIVISLEWRIDSSISVSCIFNLSEKMPILGYDHKGQKFFDAIIPKDKNDFEISTRVTSKDDDGDTFADVHLFISNNLDFNPPVTP